MKILHLMLGCFYIDNYSYQENYLPKYHKMLGNEVEIVASLVSFDENGKSTVMPKADKYTNEYGIPVTRLDYKKGKLAKKLRYYIGLRDELVRIAPDVIFIHGVQFMDIKIVSQYCKEHRNVKVYADNHSDFSNSAKNWVSKYILHRAFWRSCAQKINPYVVKFYGVLPARVNFLADVYGIPKDKIELLVMGADDEMVEKAIMPCVQNDKRREYGIGDSDIVIVTGGKIDKNKPEVLLLMDAVKKLERDNIKLLVFGSVIPDYQEEFNSKLSDQVVYLGWKKPDEIYYEFAVADIVAFPGLHSVLWEQAVGMKKPCIFRKIKGFSHVDLGGNCCYFEEDTVDSYSETLKKAIDNIEQMNKFASKKESEIFSYKKIAERSIEV